VQILTVYDCVCFSGLLDSYEEAKGNQYSIDIKSLLANQPLNGQRMNSASGAGTKQLQLPDQLCRVAQVTPSHKVSLHHHCFLKCELFVFPVIAFTNV